MRFIRTFLPFILLIFSHSVFSQTGLTKLIGAFPSYDAIITQFYNNYAPEAGQDPNTILNFARKPSGWYLITYTIQDQEAKTATPFWLPASGFLSLSPLFSTIQDNNKVLFPHYQSEEYAREYHNLRMFNLHTFYGYQGWADDIVAELKSLQMQLNDEDLYSLGRAHSARASSMVHHNNDGSNLAKIDLKQNGNSLSEQQLTDYFCENLAARECFKIIANRNPTFYDIVGKIQTKYANEVVQAYLDLLIFQKEELAKKQLIPNIYPPEILAHARNYLNNIPKGAIFISYGDNDTYPLWYLQVMENLRTDVWVINYSLLGLSQYTAALRRGMNGNKMNLSINQSTYDTLEIVVGNVNQSELNEQAFIAWMNDPKKSNYQSNNFPGLYLSCEKHENQHVIKEHFYKMEIALLDLYISNKERPFCGSYNSSPLDIFGNNWINRGLVEELNLCSEKTINFDSILSYYSQLDQEAYTDAKNFPVKPGTQDYIDDVVLSKLYQNLLQNMLKFKEANQMERLEKLKVIWSQWNKNWVVKPSADILNYYELYLKSEAPQKPVKGQKKR